jgi:hypothetical protein
VAKTVCDSGEKQMPLQVQCPSCKRKLNVPDKLQGKRVKCPSCGEGFEAVETGIVSEKPAKSKSGAIAPAAKRPPKPPEEEYEEPLAEPEPEDEEESKPRRRRSRDDDDDDDEDRPRRRRARDDDEEDEDDRPRRRRRDDDDLDVRRKPKRPHRGGLVLTLGILSIPSALCCALIGLILGGITLNLAKQDLADMSAGRMDRSGQGITVAGNICAMVGVVLGILNIIAYVVLKATGTL